ncbi:hypothetical protein Tco_0236780 [Tanacetum coccineum]
MTTLKFADTHNMVTFLSKPAESEGFEQIVDFLNAHPIKHALTVNPTIYTLCIKQFWATVKAKTINEEVQLQALVNGKKIIITESTMRRDLQLEDAEGVDCLPNATIFEQLALMGYGQDLCYTSHTKKFFGEHEKGREGFLEGITPLFLTNGVTQSRRISVNVPAIQCPLLHTHLLVQPSPQLIKTQNLGRHRRKDTQVPQSSVPSDTVADEAIYKELDDSLVRVVTTTSSLEAEQDSGNIIKTRSKATPNEAGSQGTSSGCGPRRQEAMGDTIAQTRFENVSKLSNDPLLARDNTLQSGEDSLKLNELMELCTDLQQRVLHLDYLVRITRSS